MSVQTICYYFRPIAGFINICPTALQASLIRDLKATVKHEVLHVLVSDFIGSGIYTRTCRTHTSLVRFINRYCACHSCTHTGVQLCAVCILERWVRESKNTEKSFYQLTTHNRWWNLWIPKASFQHYIHLILAALRGIKRYTCLIHLVEWFIFCACRFAWREDTIRRVTVSRDTFSGPVSQSVDILVTPAVVVRGMH